MVFGKFLSLVWGFMIFVDVGVRVLACRRRSGFVVAGLGVWRAGVSWVYLFFVKAEFKVYFYRKEC